MKPSAEKYVIDDIARKAGVSISTVSRALNKRPYVKAAVRDRVLRVAASVNYNPKVTARKDSIVIAASGVEDLRHGGFTDMAISGIVRGAIARELRVEIVPATDIDIVLESFSRAVIGIVYDEKDAAALRKIRNIPVLTVNNIVEGFHYVCTDHFESARIATRHLLDNGHRRIALFTSPTADKLNWGCVERVNGYKRALAEYDVSFSEDLLAFDARHIVENLARVIHARQPTALIVTGEGAALPVWHALRLLDKKIPDDISVVLFESPSVTPYLFPNPTVVRQDFDHLGEQAVNGVVGLLDGSPDRVAIMLPVDFKEGASVKNIDKGVSR